MWPRLPFLALSIAFALPPFISMWSDTSLTFILPSCLQGCVCQAALSGLPPSSAALSPGLNVMNEGDAGREWRGSGADGWGGGVSLEKKGKNNGNIRMQQISGKEMLLHGEWVGWKAHWTDITNIIWCKGSYRGSCWLVLFKTPNY